MKLFVVALFALVAIQAVCAVPLDLEAENAFDLPEEAWEEGVYQEERADRHRRVTCDLLSYGGKVNHAACAANCLTLGKAGGRCNDGVCQCRKTSFKDLWDKRFG